MYFKINNNFSNFYSIVQNFNSFDLEAKELIETVEEIKKNIGNTRMLARKELAGLQMKIFNRQKISRLLKVLETIKYVDQANTTIKTMLDKTNFKKINELLVVLNSSVDNKLNEIKVLDNKWEEIKKLKNSFFDKLVGIVDRQVDLLLEKAYSKFSEFIEKFDPDSFNEFNLKFDITELEDSNSIKNELNIFKKEESLYNALYTHFLSKFGKQNKALTERLAKMLIFKYPNTVLFKSYRNYINYLFNLYQSILPYEGSETTFGLLLQGLTKNASFYIRRAIDVLDLENIDIELANGILVVIGSFEKFYNIQGESDALFESLQIYFKKIVVNARQHRFCAELKRCMETEDWTSESISSHLSNILEDHFKDNLCTVTHDQTRINNTTFYFTNSFTYLINALNEIELFCSQLDGLDSLYYAKIKDIIEMYLKNCESLILHGMALHFNKIKKINTKILSKLIRSHTPPDKFHVVVYKQDFTR